MTGRRACMLAVVLFVAGCQDDPAPRTRLLLAENRLPWTGGPLLDSLKRGGYILYFRHFHTDHSRWHEDPIKPKHGEMTVKDFLATCDQQRPLTPFGRRRAKEIGDFIRRLGIPIGQVLSSPYCRAVESATLLGGRAPDSTLYDLLHPGGTLTYEMMARNVRPHLAQIPPAGTNTIMVAHRPQMDDVRFIEEGECFVLQPLGNGKFNVVATIYDSDWYEAQFSVDYLGLRARQPGGDMVPRGVTK